MPSRVLLTRCPQCDEGHPQTIHSVSTAVSTSYPEMSKVVEILLTVVLRTGKVTPPDAQCTARCWVMSPAVSSTLQGVEPGSERPARGNQSPQGGWSLRAGWCDGYAGRVTSKASSTAGWVHESGPGRRPGGARSAGAPQGAKEVTRRGTGCGPEECGRLRPEGYSGPNRVLPRLWPTCSCVRGVFHSPWG